MPARPRPPTAVLVVVALGGASGAVLRYTLDALTAGSVPIGGFPWTTFAVNVVGAFLLGALPVLLRVRRSALLAPFLGPGVLGGFTTLSAVSEQTRSLVADERVVTAATYSLGTLVASLLAVAAAEHLGRAHRGEDDR